ncbi:hypothetical protein JCM1393_17310 [Clostridium carnis]
MIKINTDYSTKGLSIVNEAKKYLGFPYKWNSNGPDSFDAAGLVQFVYKKSLGINLPRDIYNQIKLGKTIPFDELIAGDLIFSFNGEHVSIYIGNNQVIHSPFAGKKVRISTLFNFYTAKRLI